MTPAAASNGRAAPAALWPYAAVVVAMLSIQAGAALAKSLFPAVGPTGATTLRLVLAAALLVPLLRAWRGVAARLRSPALIAYGVALGGMNLLFYVALQRIPLGAAVAIEFTGPLAVAIAQSRRAMDFLWAALAAGGLWLLLQPGSAFGAGLDPLGLAAAAGAGACWAAYIVMGSRAGLAHGGTTVATGMVIAMLCALPFGIATAGVRLLDPALLPVAFAVAVLSSALPYSLEMQAMTRLPMRTFGILMSLEPAIATGFGLVLLGERLAPLQVLAIGCVVAASAGSAISPRRASC